jgi:ArsR family transcriptional regulator
VDVLLRATKSVSDANRLRILRVLGGGPFNVAELTRILELGQSTVSRHLKLLAEAGLVEARRTGTWAYYSLRGGAEGFPGDLLRLLTEAFAGCENPDAVRVERVLAERRHATSRFFRRAAGEWDRVRDAALGPSVHADRLVELAGTGGTVVDLGTGTGVLLARLGRVADRVIGVDASAEMLEVARRRLEENELENAELRLGTLEHLPLSDGEADAMVANLVLHHVADVPQVLRDVRRGLAPGGRLLVADLEEHEGEELLTNLGARWPGFRPDELGEWLRTAGFSDVCFESDRAPDGTDGTGPAAGSAESDRPRVFLVRAVRGEG